MTNKQTTDSTFKQVYAGLDIFDPFQGFINDDKKQLNFLYGFRLGAINFLINKSTKSEVIKKPTIYPIPNTPEWIHGLINLRGMLIPVFDIKKQLEQHDDASKKNDTLLIIDRGVRAFSIFIDNLPNTINLDDPEFIKPTIPPDIPKILNGFIIAAFSFKQEIWLDIDYNAFLRHITLNYSDYQTDVDVSNT